MSDTMQSKREQFHFENKTWERLLDFFKQENAFLKTRLAEVLDQSSNREFLAFAEQFQSRFILNDEFIDELRHDINIQERKLKDNYINNITLLDIRIIKKQEKLRNEMAYMEKDFPQLKYEFNKYLITILR